MRVCSYSRPPGPPRVGAQVGHAVLDLERYSHLHPGLRLPGDMLLLIDAGPTAWEHARELCRRFEAELTTHDLAQDAEAGLAYALDGVRWHAPIPRPRKNIVCLGRNYAAHARELRQELPEAPIFFTKAPTAVIGPEDAIPYPPGLTTKLDWEVELGVVIGNGGRDLHEAQALDHVFGYTVINDVTARDLQTRHGQWFKGKSLDGSCPMGPVIVTGDEIPDPQGLQLWLRVNGVLKQQGNTRDMVFPVARILAELSAGMTLEPGDCVATGTPEGVGDGRQPPEYLHPGDLVEAEVGGIGVLRNRVVPGTRIP